MPTIDLVQKLVRSHVAGDEAKFRQALDAMIANEKAAGHEAAARKLESAGFDSARPSVIQMPQRDECRKAFREAVPTAKLADLVLPADLRRQIDRILAEQRAAERLAEFGLKPRRKLLLVGPPGCGKTMTAAVLADELDLPLYVLQATQIVDSLLGKTAANLGNAFTEMTWKRAVYLFDEFDGIACRRGGEQDVGEMRRVVNTLLQLIEKDQTDGIIVAATNDGAHIDPAMFRRFDDVLEYPSTTPTVASRLVSDRLGRYDIDAQGFALPDGDAQELAKLSQAEIVRLVDDAVKEHVITGEPVSPQLVMRLACARTSTLRSRPNVKS